MSDEQTALQAGALSDPNRMMQRFGRSWRADGPFDWTGCPDVEVNPGKVSGVPLLIHTRMPADSVLNLFEGGMSPEEIAEDFELDLSAVEAVLRFAGVFQGMSAVA